MEPNVNEVEKDDAALENEVTPAEAYPVSIKKVEATETLPSKNVEAKASSVGEMDRDQLHTFLEKYFCDKDKVCRFRNRVYYDAIKDVNVSLFIIMYKCMNSLFN